MSAAYQAMAAEPGPVSDFVERSSKVYLLKYGTGPLDQALVSHGLVDEFRIWIVPVTNPPGQCLFAGVDDARLTLVGTRTFASGVLVLTSVPAGVAGRP